MRTSRTVVGHYIALCACIISWLTASATLGQPEERPELFLQLGHTGGITCLAFSPDGSLLVTGSWDNTAKLWDAETGQLLRTLRGHLACVHSLAFSPDGGRLATGSGDMTIGIWDATTGTLLQRLEAHADRVYSVAFSPDGRRLASASYDKTIKVWDAETGQVLRTLEGHSGAVNSVAFGPEGRRVVSGSQDTTVKLWDAGSGELLQTLQGHAGSVRCVAFSPDGSRLASGGVDKTIGVWSGHTGQLLRTLRGDSGSVQCVAFGPDGRRLASGSSDGAIRLWDTETGQLLRTLEGDSHWVLSVAFSPDGRRLASGSWHATLKLWEAETGQTLWALQADSPWIRCIAFAPDGRRVAYGGDDRTVKVWDAATGELLRTLGGHSWRVTSIAFRPDGKRLASGSEDSTVRLWDAETGQVLQTLKGHGSHVHDVAFSPDGRRLASASCDKTIRLWDPETGELLRTLRDSSPVQCLAFSPDGTQIASGSRGKAVTLWDPETGQATRLLTGHSSFVESLAFSPDGTRLASGSHDRTIKLWDRESGETIWTAQCHSAGHGGGPASWEQWISSLAFSPDGRWLAAACEDMTVKLCDPGSGRIVRIIEGHSDTVQGVAIAPDGRRFASGGGDGRARLWSMPDGRPLAQLVAPTGKDIGPRTWFTVTPEGYFDCSTDATKLVTWRANGALYPVERYVRRFRRPDLVRKALRGEEIDAPPITNADIPPAVRFVGLRDGDVVLSDPMTVTVEATDDGEVKEVELFVNGRPLPPETARPIEVDARPIVVDAKDIDPHHRFAKELTFRLRLPLGAEEIRLRAVAYDDTDLGSDPVEVVLKWAGAQPVPGHLYVLSVGVSRYRNADGNRLKNLRFPAADAEAIAQRFRREGKPLYEQVEVRLLTDEQATLKNVRAGLRWLRQSVRPGQIDTVVIFLSGHGVSLNDGRYCFGTHDIDLDDIPGTSLSGRELCEALGGQLRANAVFLFADTCHSGGMRGRNDDLALELANAGVYFMASSGATEYSYESTDWGHGAFTAALLRALGEKALVTDGRIYYSGVIHVVLEEMAQLMREAGRNEGEQEPCIPLAPHRLRVPILPVVQ